MSSSGSKMSILDCCIDKQKSSANERFMMTRYHRILVLFGVVLLGICGLFGLLNKTVDLRFVPITPTVVVQIVYSKPTLELTEISATTEHVTEPTRFVTALPVPTQLPRGYVSRQIMGDAWPFSTDSGIVGCLENINNLKDVVFVSEGVIYAINGIARNSGKYADISSIWLDNPNLQGAKISIGPIISLGLKMCAD